MPINILAIDLFHLCEACLTGKILIKVSLRSRESEEKTEQYLKWRKFNTLIIDLE